jgi:hypothetical protein
VNIHDAATIAHPFRERDLDPPAFGWWSKADEDHYQRIRDSLVAEYIAAHAAAIEEWCRDRFIDTTESAADAALDAERERDTL